ncbi:Saf4/Yju2 family protein [Rhodotorula paludigena]|uniref:Saf4/Yju2 family protein n=1 Tax=Rhodotorula paludigena TaxID=86838 RepID=UPI00317E5296
MQGFNKYYPPDYEPDKHKSLNSYHGKHALGKRAHKIDQGILVVRFELPYNIWCGHCNAHVGQGVRYNAEKQKVGNYYSTPIYAFRFKCHLCSGRIEIRTDPQNTRYVVTEGARQKNEEWDPAENGQIVIDNSASTSTAPPDPFASLEKTVTQKQRALTEAERLSALEEHNASRWSDPFAASRALRSSFRGKKRRIVESETKAEGVRERFGLADERVGLADLRTPTRGSREAMEEEAEWEKAKGEMKRARDERDGKRRKDEERVGWRAEEERREKVQDKARRKERSSASSSTRLPTRGSSSSATPRPSSRPSGSSSYTASPALKALHSRLSLASALKQDPFGNAPSSSSSEQAGSSRLARSSSIARGMGLDGVNPNLPFADATNRQSVICLDGNTFRVPAAAFADNGGSGHEKKAPLSPAISGGFARSLSVSSTSGSEADEPERDERPRQRRPFYTHRSESLPSFPPPPLEPQQPRDGVSAEELASLPPNPKLWLPSHLSLYLASTLSLAPLIRTDVTSFIVASRLSGRTFLRLREQDLEDLGINVLWRKALLDAREVLRREALGGRVLWGFEGAASSAATPELEAGPHSKPEHRRRNSWQLSSAHAGSRLDVEGSASEDESSKEEWKQSWRRLQRGGAAGRRVKGLRKAFETVEEVSERGSPEKSGGSSGRSTRRSAHLARSPFPSHWRIMPQQAHGPHMRSDSIDSAMSEASIDSLDGKYAVPLSTSLSAPSDDPFFAPIRTSSRARPFPLELGVASTRLELDLAAPPRSPTRPSTTISETLRPLPFALESPAPKQPVKQAQKPVLRPEGTLSRAAAKAADAAASGALGGSDTLRARKVSFRELEGQKKDNAVEHDDEEDEEEEEEQTIRPIKRDFPTASSLSSASASAPEWGLPSPTSASSHGKASSLAELFGLDMPRSAQKATATNAGDELVTMFVPGLPRPREEQADADVMGEASRGGKKGSLVLVRKSQFAALQRRMSEVEAQLAAALSSNGDYSAAMTPQASGPEDGDDDDDDERVWEYKGEEVTGERLREMEAKMQDLELNAQHIATSLPASPTPSARAFASLPSPPASASSLTTAYPSVSSATLPSLVNDNPSSATPTGTTKNRRSQRSRRAGRQQISSSTTDERYAEQEPLDDRVWPIDGWRQLSGYVVAASIGIGIVAGEVVAAKILGLRRR